MSWNQSGYSAFFKISKGKIIQIELQIGPKKILNFIECFRNFLTKAAKIFPGQNSR